MLHVVIIICIHVQTWQAAVICFVLYFVKVWVNSKINTTDLEQNSCEFFHITCDLMNCKLLEIFDLQSCEFLTRALMEEKSERKKKKKKAIYTQNKGSGLEMKRERTAAEKREERKKSQKKPAVIENRRGWISSTHTELTVFSQPHRRYSGSHHGRHSRCTRSPASAISFFHLRCQRGRAACRCTFSQFL